MFQLSYRAPGKSWGPPRSPDKGRMRVFFPDTNFFFECRKASDLPWHELSNTQPDEDIRLIVPSAVVTEIERHKTKGNSRTAKRARDASALLRKALESANHSIELRIEKPRITLELPAVVKVDVSVFPNLDPARADHQIAAEYAARLMDIPDLALLSDDTLLVLTARSLGFDPILIPESWKLAPEKDGRDDEIDKLRDELRIFRQTSPDVSVSVQNSHCDEIAAIKMEIEKFEPSEEDFDRALAAVQARFPMEHNSQPAAASVAPLVQLIQIMRGWRLPTADEIETYKTQDYPRWLVSVRKKLPAIATLLTDISHEIPCMVLISNTGFVNATDVRLTITGFDGIMLRGDIDEHEEKERSETLSLPAPPQPPRARYMDYSSLFAGDFGNALSSPFDHIPDLIKPRDPNSFYYVENRSGWPSEQLEVACAALPHQIDPYRIGFRVVATKDEMGNAARLRVKVRASNLKRPIERFIPVSATVRPGNFLQALDQEITQLE